MLVEFMEGGVFALALVTNREAPRGRLGVLLSSGRGMTVSPARILVSVDCGVPDDRAGCLALLREVEARREALADGVDLAELWDVLEGEGPDFGYADLAALSFGHEPCGDEVSAVMRAIQEEGVLFEFSPGQARRRDAGQIGALRETQAKVDERRELMARLSGWLRESSLGHFAPEPEGADQACQELLGLALEGNASPLAAQAKEVLALADLPSTPSGAFKALVDAGRLGRHENLALIRLGLNRDFDPDVLAEAASLARNFRPDGEGRLDLTAVPTATVDALGAREYDDAISLEPLPGGGHRLGLHIADVAAMVPPGSLVDKWAAVQISSIYLPEGRRPMLPEALTEGLASLRAGEDKPAFSLLATLDAAGQLLDYQFRPTLVRVDLQVSFPKADELLESGQGGILEPLESLSLGLLSNRLAAGGQNLNLPHLNVTLNAEGRTEVWLTDDGSRSNLMVGEFMILANHLAARTLMEASVACPFRFQNPARPLAWNPPKPLSGRVELAVALASRRLVGRGGLSLEPLAHSGLGLGPYTSFTSPMRRYLDLLVARQLRAHSTGKAPAYSRQDMLGLALPAEETQRAIRRMQNDRQRYWLAWHLAGQVGQDFVALVYDRRGRRGRLCITDLMLEVELPSLPDAARPGSDVILRLARSAPGPELPGTDRDDMLRFEFVSLA